MPTHLTTADSTATGLSILASPDVASARSTLELGSLATVTPTGTPDGTKFLRDDNSWQTPSGGSGGGLDIHAVRKEAILAI